MVPSLKRKMDFSMPSEKKLVGDAMKITRTSWRLASIRPPTPRDSSSAGENQWEQESKGAKKSEMAKEVYTPYWTLGKNSRLTSTRKKSGQRTNYLHGQG